jgi:hypothetical protein
MVSQIATSTDQCRGLQTKGLSSIEKVPSVATNAYTHAWPHVQTHLILRATTRATTRVLSQKARKPLRYLPFPVLLCPFQKSVRLPAVITLAHIPPHQTKKR